MKKNYILEFTKNELKILMELLINELSQNIELLYDMTISELIDTNNQSLKNQCGYASILKKINKKIQIGRNEKVNDEQ